jgi:hypothetical protein
MKSKIKSLENFKIENGLEMNLLGGYAPAEDTYTHCMSNTNSGSCSDLTTTTSSDDGKWTMTLTQTCC